MPVLNCTPELASFNPATTCPYSNVSRNDFGKEPHTRFAMLRCCHSMPARAEQPRGCQVPWGPSRPRSAQLRFCTDWSLIARILGRPWLHKCTYGSSIGTLHRSGAGHADLHDSSVTTHEALDSTTLKVRHSQMGGWPEGFLLNLRKLPMSSDITCLRSQTHSTPAGLVSCVHQWTASYKLLHSLPDAKKGAT